MQIAILAGGLATRLGGLTRDRPKSMIKIAGKPFLEYQLDLLRKGGITNIILCLGHAGEQVERHFGNGQNYGIDLKYSFEDKLLGTAGALKNAEALLNETFFVMYGDSYLFLDFNDIMSYFNSQNKLALMTVYQNADGYERSNTAVKGDLVTKFSKMSRTQDMVYIEYGLNIFRKEILNMVPERQFCSLEHIFPRLIEIDEILAFQIEKRYHEIGSFQGLREFKNYIKERR